MRQPTILCGCLPWQQGWVSVFASMCEDDNVMRTTPLPPVYLDRFSLLGGILLTLLLVGCSSPPVATRLFFLPGSFPSRDGTLQYRVPAGWFDATADSQAAGHLIWVLRNDYGASLTIDRIHLDSSARRVLDDDNSLLTLASLLAPLMHKDRPGVVQQMPKVFELDGRAYCGYEMESPDDEDILRVVLFDTGEEVYVATLFMASRLPAASREDLHALQEGFLSALRW